MVVKDSNNLCEISIKRSTIASFSMADGTNQEIIISCTNLFYILRCLTNDGPY